MTTLNDMDNPTFTTKSNFCIILFELEKETTYYCYLEAIDNKCDVKTDVFKSSSVFISDTNEEEKEEKKY